MEKRQLSRIRPVRVATLAQRQSNCFVNSRSPVRIRGVALAKFYKYRDKQNIEGSDSLYRLKKFLRRWQSGQLHRAVDATPFGLRGFESLPAQLEIFTNPYGW
ncbi:MAG: hypothetical protein UV01_C0009G0047 [Parcubacteria group bacterium GW2011_GWA2_42_14]|nr:MAG: hypothetical protein UV01_C0009G0047 [Parcubacteria group bacterium GW2011_GWA2_42_14]